MPRAEEIYMRARVETLQKRVRVQEARIRRHSQIPCEETPEDKLKRIDRYYDAESELSRAKRLLREFE
jgi:hypothetical protein